MLDGDLAWEGCARNSGVVKVIEKHVRGGRRAGTACAKRICRSVCVCVCSRQMDLFITYADNDRKAAKKQGSKCGATCALRCGICIGVLTEAEICSQPASRREVVGQSCLIRPSCGRSVSNEHDSRATRRNKTENKTEQLHSLFGQRGGSSRKCLNPSDEIVICVFETGERMIR